MSNRGRMSARAQARSRPSREQVAQEQTPLLLRTKLHPPRTRAETLERPRLSLPPDSEAAIVLLVAPPGFGKSTLIAQWQEQSGRPFAWVSLDPGDNDPVLLWRYIFEAIRGVASDLGAGAEPPP